MRYRTRNIERLRNAVRDNARRIGSPDLRQSVREHPDGVWNPIYVVPALVLEEDPSGETETVGFVHATEGSTRAVTCLEALGIAYDDALAYARATSDLVRRARAGVATRLSVSPTDADVHLAVKVLTMPAHIIVGVLDTENKVSHKPYPQVIGDFVQSIHEQPRPWNVLAQGGVWGERLVLDLVAKGSLTRAQGDDIINRDEHHEITTAPNVIAGRAAACDHRRRGVRRGTHGDDQHAFPQRGGRDLIHVDAAASTRR